MKTTLLFFIALTAFNFGTLAQNVNIPDLMFKNYLVTNTAINTNGDDEIQVSEASAYTGTIDCTNKYITDLTGIEAFTAITELKCSENDLTILDVSQNTAMTAMWCSDNNLTSIILPESSALTIVICNKNELEFIDLTPCSGLEILNCSKNNLTAIDITQNSALIDLDCTENNLTALDLTQTPALTALRCGWNDLTTLDVTQNPELFFLSFSYNDLTAIDITQNPVLSVLVFSNNALTAIDVSHLPNFYTLGCDQNFITTLDLSQNPVLMALNCANNALTSLNVANGNNQIMYNFNSTNNPDLECIQVDDVEWYTNNLSNWKDATATFSTNCGGPVGVEQRATISNISIYPNPASSKITIDTPDLIETVHIYNLIGELVQTKTTPSFSITDLANGIYILKIKTNTGTVNKRFVKP